MWPWSETRLLMAYVESPTVMLAPQLASVIGLAATLRTLEGESEPMSCQAPTLPVACAWYHAWAMALRLGPALHVPAASCCSGPGGEALVWPTEVPTYRLPRKVSICQATLPLPMSRTATGAPVPPGML